jgi:hypothetical protein
VSFLQVPRLRLWASLLAGACRGGRICVYGGITNRRKDKGSRSYSGLTFGDLRVESLGEIEFVEPQLRARRSARAVAERSCGGSASTIDVRQNLRFALHFTSPPTPTPPRKRSWDVSTLNLDVS